MFDGISDPHFPSGATAQASATANALVIVAIVFAMLGMTLIMTLPSSASDGSYVEFIGP